MAAFSALKNRQNQKMREKMEDILVRCGDTGHGLEVSGNNSQGLGTRGTMVLEVSDIGERDGSLHLSRVVTLGYLESCSDTRISAVWDMGRDGE